MFEAFQRRFPFDGDRVSVDTGTTAVADIPGADELISRFGGSSFGQGIYRVIRAPDLDDWAARVCSGFPEYAGRIACFSYDWLGRVFAVDRGRLENAQPGVVMFEPGTGEALEIHSSLLSFHEQELIEFAEAALAVEFHEQWLVGGGAVPGYFQCVGYRTPLLLGGADAIENLELSDLDATGT